MLRTLEQSGFVTQDVHSQRYSLGVALVAVFLVVMMTSRIEEAKRLLALCERPIKGVALACGFAHANSFARAFRRSTGISPQSFRQRALPSGPPALNPPAL